MFPLYPCPYILHAAHPALCPQTSLAHTNTLTPALHKHNTPSMHTQPPRAPQCREQPELWGAQSLWAPPTSANTPVPHQFHQHCLWLKKHVSSCGIGCICLFVMVTVGYTTAVLLFCLICLVLIALWSIATAMICTYPCPREAEPCPSTYVHVLHHPGCHVQEPIPLPGHSPGASTTHGCPLHGGTL